MGRLRSPYDASLYYIYIIVCRGFIKYLVIPGCTVLANPTHPFLSQAILLLLRLGQYKMNLP